MFQWRNFHLPRGQLNTRLCQGKSSSASQVTLSYSHQHALHTPLLTITIYIFHIYIKQIRNSAAAFSSFTARTYTQERRKCLPVSVILRRSLWAKKSLTRLSLMSDAQLDFLSERLAHAWAQHTSGDYVTPISKLSRFIVVINRQQRGDFRNNWTARSKSHFRRSASKVLKEKSCWPNIFTLGWFSQALKERGSGRCVFFERASWPVTQARNTLCDWEKAL